MKKEHMPSISVSKATGERIAAAAKQHGCTMADLVREACRDILETPPIEVSEDLYARMAAAAEKFDCSIADIVTEACAGILSGAAR